MTGDELLERVNRWATTRYGAPVSKRKLQDLVIEELVCGPVRVPHPGQRAARWEWSRRSYAQLLWVCRAQHRGLKTFDQLRIWFWLRGSEALTEKVRDSMLREHRRLYKRLFRPLRTDAGPTLSEEKPSNRRVRGLDGQKRDERLKPIGDLISRRILSMAYDAMRFGAAFDATSLIKILGQLLPLSHDLKMERDEVTLDLSGVACLAEDDDEALSGSAEESLTKLDDERFDQARCLLRLLRRSFLAAPELAARYAPSLKDLAEVFSFVGQNMGSYPLNFGLFALCLHGTRKRISLRGFNDRAEINLDRLLNGDFDHAP